MSIAYQAVSQSPTQASSAFIAGPISQSADVESTSADNWLLQDVFVPADNIVLDVRKFSADTDENQQTFFAQGRGRKVVIGDSQIFGDTIHLEVQTLTDADFQALRIQYSKVYPLYLVAPTGEAWYVRGTKRSREFIWNGTYAVPMRTYTLDFEEVDAVG